MATMVNVYELTLKHKVADRKEEINSVSQNYSHWDTTSVNNNYICIYIFFREEMLNRDAPIWKFLADTVV